MGWLYGHDTRKSLIDHLVRGNGVHTHAHCLRGNNLWAVQEHQGKKFIALYLLRGRNGPWGWGYKDIDESMGPYYYNCPLKYLDMADEPYNDTAREWREMVRAYHARRAHNARTNAVAGNVVSYAGCRFRLYRSLRQRGWEVVCLEDDMHYRMSLNQLKEAILDEASTGASRAA